MHPLLLTWLVAAALPSRVVPILRSIAPSQSAVAGCYRFDRPLGPSGTGEPERAEPAWYVVELRAGGGVGRPLLAGASERETWERASRWRQSGDTVFVRTYTGLQGWDVVLRPAGTAYVGEARYLTDVVAIGWEPPRHPVRAERERCPVGTPPS